MPTFFAPFNNMRTCGHPVTARLVQPTDKSVTSFFSLQIFKWHFVFSFFLVFFLHFSILPFRVLIFLKDGASFCYCSYVLRISGYPGFLRNLPTDSKIFLGGL